MIVRSISSLNPRALCLSAAALAVATLSGCGSDTTAPTAKTPPAPTPNFVQLVSDSGDYIGGGLTYKYTQANAILRFTASSGLLTVSVSGDQSWTGNVQVPGAGYLKPGTYTNASRYPFNSTTTPGLSWSGEGRGCNTLTGSFTIDSVKYDSTAKLAAIDLRFDQDCDGAAGLLHGTIHWAASDTTAPPGPENPIPSTLWKPDSSFVPKAGNYVLLDSDPGDYIGQGGFVVFTAPTTPITVSPGGSHISVAAGGYDGDFQSMIGTNPIRVGYYANLERYPFNNPLKGGLSWYGDGRGCNTLTGWFAVDRADYSGATLTALDLRFEQHCEGEVPALHGAIHWTAP